jgi:hypothetical protein
MHICVCMHMHAHTDTYTHKRSIKKPITNQTNPIDQSGVAISAAHTQVDVQSTLMRSSRLFGFVLSNIPLPLLFTAPSSPHSHY